jgi:hypothetical protein
MAGFLAFDSGFSLSTPDREISSSVRPQLIDSHSLDCTRVPWESLTLMVILLALVNGIRVTHYFRHPYDKVFQLMM